MCNNNFCIDCGIKITRYAKRCKICSIKFKANPKIIFNCEQCNKEIIDYAINRRWNHIFCSKSCQGRYQMENNNPSHLQEVKDKLSLKLKGRKTGKPPWNKGLVNPEREIISILRDCYMYNSWRYSVFQRDNFKCIKCGASKLEAHHIKAFSTIVYENKFKSWEDGLKCEELWDVNNGQTLCRACHVKTDNYGFKLTNKTHKKEKSILSMKKACITGSSGLVGSAMSKLLINEGFEVYGIDYNLRGILLGEGGSTEETGKELVHKYKDFHQVNLDIRNREGIKDFFKDNKSFDFIIHCAAQPSHQFSIEETFVDFDINALGTINIIESYRRFSPESIFIHVSSSKVYGDSVNELPLIEYDTRYDLPKDNIWYEGVTEEFGKLDGNLHSPFGASKACADIIAKEYGTYFNLPIAIFRPVCISGSKSMGIENHGYLAYLAKCINNGIPYTVNGYKQKMVRDNIHGEDLANAFYEVYKNSNNFKPGEAFNIGGGRLSNNSMMEAISQFETILGKKGNILYSEEIRKGDHQWCIYDSSKFKKAFPNWEIKYDNNKLMEEICSQYK